MTTYTYNVTADGPTKTIQQAISNLGFELSQGEVIERDIEIMVGDGTYPGFSIPDGLLDELSGTTHRLIIRSAGNFFPVIDYNRSPEGKSVGADVGANNPNVTISGLRFQYFAVGIRAAENSHNIKVNKCVVTNNRNAAIFIENCDNAQILQSIVINGDYGIVTRLCKDAAIVHNTVFANGAISSTLGESKSCIWAQSALDYGGGLSDTGKVYIIGNIVWNTAGTNITVFQDDLDRQALVSNFNNFVHGDITLDDRIFLRRNLSKPKKVYDKLSRWRDTGSDQDSIPDDPKFIKPVKIRSNRDVFSLDLTVLPLSPVLGIVPSFFEDSGAATTWLPSHVDALDLKFDLLGKERGKSGTAIGANDKVSNSGFYGQDIFTNPIDLGLDKDCGVDPLFDIIFKELDVWFPRYKPGYFYSYDREYYLYAKKECSHLSELAVTVFELPSRLFPENLTIRVRGKEIDPDRYIELTGTRLVLYHKNLGIRHGDEEIDIQAEMLRWRDGGFVKEETTLLYKIKQGKTYFLLPNNYYARGPVSVTDDAASFTDPDEYSNREYSVSFNDYFGRSEIIFANDTNELHNGQFEYFNATGSSPEFWDSQNVEVVSISGNKYPAYGNFYCHITSSGYLARRVEATTGEHVLSFLARGDGNLNIISDYYDEHYKHLGYVKSTGISLEDDWTRYYINFGPRVCDDVDVVGNVFTTSGVGNWKHPDKLSSLYLTFTGEADIDGVQFEKGYIPTIYHRKPILTELTLEYETSDAEYYIDKRNATAPVRALTSDGFFYISEIPADVYMGPRDPRVTTLHDYRWPIGRKNVMPWARTLGKDKLRKRPTDSFHIVPEEKSHIHIPVFTTPEPFDIQLTPATPTISQADRMGVGFSVIVVDDEGNPMFRSHFLAMLTNGDGQFPGYLFKSLFGLKHQFSQFIRGQLDSSGTTQLKWIPPDDTLGKWNGDIPVPYYTDNGNKLSSITTRYPISPGRHGNVTILTDDGDFLTTEGSDTISGDYSTTTSNGFTKAYVEYPISPRKIRVYAEGTRLRQTSIAQPNTDQFYVDYDTSEVITKGSYEELNIEYVPIYHFINQSDPYRIMFHHDKVFGDRTGTIQVGYDYIIGLQIRVERPHTSNYLVRDFELVAQNSHIARPEFYNVAALEM